MSYHLLRHQVVPAPLERVFSFFKDPGNLEAITPPWLGFHVLESTDRPVREGSRVHYRLHLNGIPLGWESLITEYREGERFADMMLAGPTATGTIAIVSGRRRLAEPRSRMRSPTTCRSGHLGASRTRWRYGGSSRPSLTTASAR